METVLIKRSQGVVEKSKAMLKNGADFVCTACDLSYTQKIDNEDCMVDPPPERILEWLEQLFTVDLVSKPLNQKAIDAMKKKGVVPGRSFSDLHIKVVVVNSANAVHLAFQGDADLVDKCRAPVKEHHLSVDRSDLKVYTCPSNQAFKDRDIYMTMVFEVIKQIYPDFFTDDD